MCIINCQNVIKYNTRIWTEYLQQKYQNINRIISNIKKNIFFLVYFKILDITKEQHENNEIEEITGKFGKLWLNERHV